MPESKSRKPKSVSQPGGTPPRAQTIKPANPTWYVPVMLGLMILGLLWVVVYYVTGARWPIESIGNWNIAVGMGLILAGFGMSTNWR